MATDSSIEAPTIVTDEEIQTGASRWNGKGEERIVIKLESPLPRKIEREY
jgi:hypothetical protein